MAQPWRFGRYLIRRIHQFNPRSRSRRNVAHHYDLDGRLYTLFLDADQQYSCAYFETPDQSLDDAQLAKKRHLAAKLRVESGGLVSKLYTLNETYTIGMNDGFCTSITHLDAIEGKRHRETKVVYDHMRGKASYVERDLNKNTVKSSEVEIPLCVVDVVAGLYKVRTDKLEQRRHKLNICIEPSSTVQPFDHPNRPLL